MKKVAKRETLSIRHPADLPSAVSSISVGVVNVRSVEAWTSKPTRSKGQSLRTPEAAQMPALRLLPWLVATRYPKPSASRSNRAVRLRAISICLIYYTLTCVKANLLKHLCPKAKVSAAV